MCEALLIMHPHSSPGYLSAPFVLQALMECSCCAMVDRPSTNFIPIIFTYLSIVAAVRFFVIKSAMCSALRTLFRDNIFRACCSCSRAASGLFRCIRLLAFSGVLPLLVDGFVAVDRLDRTQKSRHSSLQYQTPPPPPPWPRAHASSAWSRSLPRAAPGTP